MAEPGCKLVGGVFVGSGEQQFTCPFCGPAQERALTWEQDWVLLEPD